MPLPPFTEYGDLPVGVHRAAFHEVGERFGSGAALEGEQAAVEYWQVRRDGQRRGVVEIDLGAS